MQENRNIKNVNDRCRENPVRWHVVGCRHVSGFWKKNIPNLRPLCSGFSDLKKFLSPSTEQYQAMSGFRNWIKSLSLEARKIVGNDIATVEFGWPLGVPVCRSLGQGI